MKSSLKSSWLFLVVALLLTVTHFEQRVVAQDKPKNGQKKDIPDPEAIQLITKKTGLQLNAAYFPSNQDKEAAPIILLHPWKEQGALYYKTAKELQALGYAVIVPDLRGHGKSINAAVARDGKIDLEKMGKVDFGFIVAEDMETIKNFLLQQHNEGKLNIELLSVIGIGEGSMFGSLWAINDWSYPPLPGLKQGQDVKAVVMISPEMGLKGMNADNALKNPICRNLSFLLVAGAKSDQHANISRMKKTLEKTHNFNPDNVEASNLWIIEPDTSLDKAQFIGSMPNMSKVIDSFLTKRVKGFAKQLPWAERKAKN